MVWSRVGCSQESCLFSWLETHLKVFAVLSRNLGPDQWNLCVQYGKTVTNCAALRCSLGFSTWSSSRASCSSSLRSVTSLAASHPGMILVYDLCTTRHLTPMIQWSSIDLYSASIYIYMYVYIYIHTYIHACMHAYIHTYVHSLHTYIHYITLHYITLHYITLHYITLHYITLHYITLHYITLHYITLHYITLHYITLHYITLHYIHTYIYIYYTHICIRYMSIQSIHCDCR